MPVTVKDILLHARRADPARLQDRLGREGSWDEDAPSVARLREHGAVFLGKTTTPEFGWKGVTDSPRHGVTRNPYDPARTAGGSSGGSAAAVALGAGPLSLGTDGGGSRPHPGLLLRDLRAEADVRAGAAVSGERLRDALARRAR